MAVAGAGTGSAAAGRPAADREVLLTAYFILTSEVKMAAVGAEIGPAVPGRPAGRAGSRRSYEMTHRLRIFPV